MITTTEKQQQQLKELQKNIWNICCDFWGKMNSDDYKDYVLGLLFYRYLSEKVQNLAKDLLEEDNITYAQAWEDEDYKEDIADEILKSLGFLIEPKYLFNSMYDMINVSKKGFDIEYLTNAINTLMDSTRGLESEEAFNGIFEDMDLSSTKLGKSVSDRSTLIAKAITNIGGINFDHNESEIDIMGDAYEYLIGQFAADGGKKSGSFYTPAQVDNLLAKIVTVDKKDILNAFDGCGGSGALLLSVGNEANVRNYYYQELTTTTYNLARMNMLIHGINYQNFHMENNDTLVYPAYLDVPMDVITANPPYSQNWSADNQFLLDERFSSYGVLAPKSKADFAFLLSMFHTLKEDGTMAVVLPHGVLFRGGTESKIRETLIRNNNIDTIIGLPANCFYGTSIPTIVIVLKKNKKTDDILFIDASKDYQKGKNQNYIREEDVEKILSSYKNRADIDKYAHLATFKEIEDNEFNLNITRYVDTFEEEEKIDIKKEMIALEKTKEESAAIDKELEVYFKELGLMQKIFSQEIRFKGDNGEDYPEWEEKKFEDVFYSIPTKQFQIKTSEIEKQGCFDVVDQGKDKIAGYSNNSQKVFKDVPAIIYGDHTTIVKYRENKFIIGADGTKLLKNNNPQDNLNFLYYALEHYNIKPEGYKRHFSIIRQIDICIPSCKEEQTKIANFLSDIDKKLEKEQEILDSLNKLKKGLLQQMFV